MYNVPQAVSSDSSSSSASGSSHGHELTAESIAQMIELMKACDVLLDVCTPQR
jgi:hypothetical protein